MVKRNCLTEISGLPIACCMFAILLFKSPLFYWSLSRCNQILVHSPCCKSRGLVAAVTAERKQREWIMHVRLRHRRPRLQSIPGCIRIGRKYYQIIMTDKDVWRN